MAMRAAFLRAHQPHVWEDYLVWGTGPLLSLLSSSPTVFSSRARCTEEEVAEFSRAWLQTPAGQLYGGKLKRRRWGCEPILG